MLTMIYNLPSQFLIVAKTNVKDAEKDGSLELSKYTYISKYPSIILYISFSWEKSPKNKKSFLAISRWQ